MARTRDGVARRAQNLQPWAIGIASLACSPAAGLDTPAMGGTGGRPAMAGAAPTDAGAEPAPGRAGSGAGGAFVLPDCTSAELSAACAGRTCGPVAACTSECGTCPPEKVCFEGACAVPNCTSDPESCECGSLDFTLITRQACSISLSPGAELDGEAFIEVGGESHRVLAIDRWGLGHIIGWCDSSTTGLLVEAFDAAGYLGQVDAPRLASFGNESTCRPGVLQSASLPDSVEYLGTELPDYYFQNASLIAADYDALVFCGFNTIWDARLADLLQTYVAELGKGLLAVMDYEGVELTVEDFNQMTTITSPAGIHFNPLSLPWTDATAHVDVECVPDLRPVLR